MGSSCRFGIIVQARLKSTRLPRKILSELAGKTMLEQIVKRCKQSRYAGNRVVVICPTGEGEEIFTHTGIVPYEGPELDLLSRFLVPVRKLNIECAVRVTADCPLVCPVMMDTMIEETATPCTINWDPRTWPDGIDLDVWGRQLLEDLDKEFTSPADREWWATKAVHEKIPKRLITSVTTWNTRDLTRYRLTVDHAEDLELVRAVYKAQGNDTWTVKKITDWLDKNPKIKALNQKHVDGTFGDIY